MIINGDCLEEMKNIEDNKIDLLFCDLPWVALVVNGIVP
jgi:DNA modification methylase